MKCVLCHENEVEFNPMFCQVCIHREAMRQQAGTAQPKPEPKAATLSCAVCHRLIQTGSNYTQAIVWEAGHGVHYIPMTISKHWPECPKPRIKYGKSIGELIADLDTSQRIHMLNLKNEVLRGALIHLHDHTPLSISQESIVQNALSREEKIK